MLIYANMCCHQVYGATIYIYLSSCIYMYLIVFNFVFSAVLMGIGLNLTNMDLIWLLLY